MRIEIGDLVYVKVNRDLKIKQNNQMWIVIDIVPHTNVTYPIRIKNIHNGRVHCYQEKLLLKVETGVSC